MSAYKDKLLQISSPRIGLDIDILPEEIRGRLGKLEDEYRDIVVERNGFYAFESALHFFPVSSQADIMNAVEWNSRTLWRTHYGNLLPDNAFFFAEDIFGGQFTIFDNRIWQMDPETGSLDAIADSLEEFCRELLSDFEVLTGHPLANEWQSANRSLPQGIRLLPKMLFVMGGDYSVENLYQLDAVKGMQLRGDIATQIKDVPDGAKMKLVVEE